MPIGTVRFYREDKGWGFLTSDDPNDVDEFVHIRQIERVGYAALEQGQCIRWKTGQSERTGRSMAVELELLPPIISPPLPPPTFRDDRSEGDEAHALAEAGFMKVAPRDA